MEQFTRGGLVFDVIDSGPAAGPGPASRPAPTAARAPVVVPARSGSGGTVVLLHGFPQDATAWDAVSPALHAAGLRTLAPDQRGYSRGARPAPRSAYALPELVADVVALLDAAGTERAHVAGHDWGGGVAWALAARHPERVASLVVLSTPHPAAMAWAATHRTQGLRSWYMLAFQVPQLPERLLAARLREFYGSTGLPEPHVGRYVARFGHPAELAGPLGWYRALPSAGRGAGRGRVSGRAPGPAGTASAVPTTGPGRAPGPAGTTSAVPTTFVWGMRDPALGRAAAERTGRYVRGAYHFVQLDAGHWLPETHPDAVAREILRGVDGARRA